MREEGGGGRARRTLRVLGIETSCDETAAAIVERPAKGKPRILSNILWSQAEAHAPYGGVVPEIAARAHLVHLDGIVKEALKEAGCRFSDLDGVAATAGPGLIGGLIVGAVYGKALALALALPFLAIHHLEGHAMSIRFSLDEGESLAFPHFLALLSGGHSAFLSALSPGRYRLLGQTRDDALGEVFDKTARLLGLPYPGGPAIERLARQGEASFSLPRPFFGEAHGDMSFSGLKSAARRLAEKSKKPLSDRARRDLAASFQQAAAESLAERMAAALRLHERAIAEEERKKKRRARRGEKKLARRIVAAGGVAANLVIRAELEQVSLARGYIFSAPPPALCTDNGAMIALAGAERLARFGGVSLFAPPRARWTLSA